jgi:hypothetical protein
MRARVYFAGPPGTLTLVRDSGLGYAHPMRRLFALGVHVCLTAFRANCIATLKPR